MAPRWRTGLESRAGPRNPRVRVLHPPRVEQVLLTVLKICPTCRDEHSCSYRAECQACYNEYMRIYMQVRYAERRKEAVALLGSRCIDCGSVNELEFDHADRSLKTGDIGQLMTYSMARFRLEIEKCVLRCHECHQAKTSQELSVEHGGGITGKKSCYCEKCAPLKREYMRARRKKDKLR